MYKTVVRTFVLYGCELWNNLSAKDTQRLHVFQHSVCKTAQNLPRKTKSDICESLFGVYPISSEIDIRKLLFLGRLCLLNYEILANRIFLTRFSSFLENLSKYQLWFIPDILNLLTEYKLLESLQQWLDTGTFPSKPTWKIIVNQAVNQIFQDEDPAKFWRFPSNCYEISQCKFICNLISDQPYENSCNMFLFCNLRNP